MKLAPCIHAPAPRRSPGRGSQVTPPERREIQRMYLADGLTKAAIALKTGRTRETIAAVLQGEDFERLKVEVESETFDDARRILKANVTKAAKAWPRAVDKAADRGDHKPAKDLLMHTGVIEPLGEHGAQGPLMLIGVNIYQDMRTGQQFQGEPPSNRPILIVGSHGLSKQYEQAGLPPPIPTPAELKIIEAQKATQLEAASTKSDTRGN